MPTFFDIPEGLFPLWIDTCFSSDTLWVWLLACLLGYAVCAAFGRAFHAGWPGQEWETYGKSGFVVSLLLGGILASGYSGAVLIRSGQQLQQKELNLTWEEICDVGYGAPAPETLIQVLCSHHRLWGKSADVSLPPELRAILQREIQYARAESMPPDSQLVLTVARACRQTHEQAQARYTPWLLEISSLQWLFIVCSLWLLLAGVISGWCAYTCITVYPVHQTLKVHASRPSSSA